MVSMRDRALIEARAKGLDPEKALKGHWRQMLRFDVIGSAFAISVFLLLYYILVGFIVVYFATVLRLHARQRANALANWYWISNAIALVVFGVLTDKLRVRKPFMIVGTAISLVGSILFALSATKPDTSYYTFAVYFILSLGRRRHGLRGVDGCASPRPSRSTTRRPRRPAWPSGAGSCGSW